jgi:hypothetical protein
MLHLRIAVALLPLVIVAGCATTQSMSEADRKTIRSVSVAKTIAMPASPTVVGKATQTGSFWGGPLVMAVMMSTENPDIVQFKRHVELNRIDLGEIIRQEFIAQLKAAHAFPEVVAEGSNATFDLTIEQYGLGRGFSMSPTNAPVRPTLRMIAKLSTPDGKVVWQNAHTLTALSSEIPSYVVDEYYKTPGKFEEAFKKAGEVVAKELLKDLGEK